MQDELAQRFDSDPYIERLLNMRKTDPVTFNTFPKEVREMIEDYEKEKKQYVEQNTKTGAADAG